MECKKLKIALKVNGEKGVDFEKAVEQERQDIVEKCKESLPVTFMEVCLAAIELYEGLFFGSFVSMLVFLLASFSNEKGAFLEWRVLLPMFMGSLGITTFCLFRTYSVISEQRKKMEEWEEIKVLDELVMLLKSNDCSLTKKAIGDALQKLKILYEINELRRMHIIGYTATNEDVLVTYEEPDTHNVKKMFLETEVVFNTAVEENTLYYDNGELLLVQKTELPETHITISAELIIFLVKNEFAERYPRYKDKLEVSVEDNIVHLNFEGISASEKIEETSGTYELNEMFWLNLRDQLRDMVGKYLSTVKRDPYWDTVVK